MLYSFTSIVDMDRSEIQQLIASVRELSDQMVSRDQPVPNVNSEVSRVFGRSNQSSTGNSPSQTGQTERQSTTSTNVPSVAGNVSRFRRLANARRIGSSTNNASRNNRRPRLPDNNPFLCDLVLLNGPKLYKHRSSAGGAEFG